METQKPTVTCLIIGGKRCLQYTFPDKTEMVEEYDMKSHELLMRKIKKASNFKEAKWEYEIGEAPLNPNQQEQLLKATSANPIFLRKDTDRDFQFRIRNLPYPEEVYQIEVDEEKQQLVVRTTNKKYFKRIDVPDLARYNLKLEKGKATFSYKNSTLLISYPKPDPILLRESERRKQFEKLNAKKPREGDIEFVEN
ncbi:DPCD protein (macronuclear) [Tetrahymena thermophila SB210]|uniref:Protein DPCD n=1 Tax=Tetrahymena thermophila (strain SB210) TaxID=312017 RepID=I7MIL7_TETTS|nr:DPCD protein [Tetrahymena thermophila SB210]EAR93824.3 DPCD protein [Tetrahymena thermophila SB210]|eukprot:XP_001014069.3 DPCD protein [Tetrahymena thermophila SB210]